jgi:hypothetical protein
MKDTKKGKTYGSNMAGPQVEGMALDDSEVINLLEPTTKKKPPPSICSWCHIVGHAASNNHSKCLLTVKPNGKHYKPESIDTQRKFGTQDVCSMYPYFGMPGVLSSGTPIVASKWHPHVNHLKNKTCFTFTCNLQKTIMPTQC